MIKLTDILKEARVVPMGMDSKRKIFDALYDKHLQLFKYVTDAPTLEDFLKAGGYEDYTLEDYLVDNWGFDENSNELRETIKLIEDYYKFIKPGDVKQSNGGEPIKVSGYTHAELVCVDDGCFIVLTKF